MKRSQIILLVVSIVITGGIYVQLKLNQKDQPKTLKEEDKTVHVRTVKAKNAPHRITLVSYGQIEPNTELMVSFEVQGKLEIGALEMKPGTNFKTSQILYSVDNREAYLSLESSKANLANLIIASLPDIELDFPSETDKWIRFASNLNPKVAQIPALPKTKSTKEEMYFLRKNLYPQYYNLLSLEHRMDKYKYIAPFSGTVLETYAEPGSIMNPGFQVAKIAKTGDYEVKVPIAIEDLESYKDKSIAEFNDPSGKKIGTGSILRISDVINQQTQSADVYFSIKAIEGEKIYNGMYVNVSIDKKEAIKETVVLPRTAMTGGKVNILEDNKIKSIRVQQVGSIPDSIYVIGIKDGQSVILEQLGKIEKDVIYKDGTK